MVMQARLYTGNITSMLTSKYVHGYNAAAGA